MKGMDSVDWQALCRRVVARQRELFASHRTIGAPTEYAGRGEGGDMSLVLDRRCEDIVFEELEGVAAEGTPLIAVSEERGEVELGEGGDDRLRVIIDPIDGSLNVRRTIPSHSLSIAVATADSMEAVVFGFVHDFGADEEFAATLGEGATLDGEPFDPDPPDLGLEVVGLESAEPGMIGPSVEALEGKAYRLRAVGSIAITMSYVAAARFDGMLSARPCRSVDAAAAQLIVREAGGSVDFGGAPLSEAPLGLDARYPVAAVRRAEHLETILAAQAVGPALRR
jgi:myo-inositol-1(or 4)-monophosphatase